MGVEDDHPVFCKSIVNRVSFQSENIVAQRAREHTGILNIVRSNHREICAGGAGYPVVKSLEDL